MIDSTTQPTLLSAGHGFLHFSVSPAAFTRSLYLNLLLQPRIAIPDHYFLQGEYMGTHLDSYPGRDSWLESGLRDGIVVPYLRQESTLSGLLFDMESADRRGFSRRAGDIARRLDDTPFEPNHWSSTANSGNFASSLSHYMTAEDPPILENQIDPDDFVGFWHRSREWIGEELNLAREHSSEVLGSDGILLSQLIQVSGERLLGADCGRIESIDQLLARVRDQVGALAERDLRAFYVCACEIYNRCLADTMATTPNSPDWRHFIAAMDLWKKGGAGAGHREPFIDEVVRLPLPSDLRKVSGDVLSTIRRSGACERYLESLSRWQANPHDDHRQDQLVGDLRRYAELIRKEVGKDVAVFGLKPRFISKSSDISRALERGPGVIQGFLATGTTATTAGVATGTLPPLAAAYGTAGLALLFCLQLWAKDHSPSRNVRVELSPSNGARVHPDVTVSRA